jgi:hypothetical protein
MARSRMIGVVAALAGSLFGSCVEDSVSIRVDCVVPPNDDCTYPGDGDTCLSDGTFNVGSAREYYAAIRVVNAMRARARTSPPLAEPNGLTISGFDVHIKDASGASVDFGALPNPFFAPSSGYLQPAGGKFPAVAVLVPESYAAILATRLKSARTAIKGLLISVGVRGRTDGGVSVTSADYVLPVAIVSASNDPNPAQPECREDDGTVCLVGQDKWAYSCDPDLVAQKKAAEAASK